MNNNDNSKPQTDKEYIIWLKNCHQVDITSKSQIYYESAANKILLDFKDSRLWADITGRLKYFNQQYYLATHYYLFANDGVPELQVKPFGSFLLKSFRKNVINNPNWPNQPDYGWVLPTNWYEKSNDIVRTCFVVKYLDGVSFFAEQIQSLSQDNGLACTVDFEAKEEGYYAAHLYVDFECEIPKENWDTLEVTVPIEFQITTQLQEVISKLLHKHYEARRKNIGTTELKWQWDYESDEFAANYLGHILHYVEGMIMDVRNRQQEKTQ